MRIPLVTARAKSETRSAPMRPFIKIVDAAMQVSRDGHLSSPQHSLTDVVVSAGHLSFSAIVPT